MQTEHINVVSETSVDSSKIQSWHDVDWKVVNSHVAKLRARIFACKKKGDFKKLRKLQKLMLQSTSNLLSSIRKVTYSSGRKTPGIDGEISISAQARFRLFQRISKISLVEYKPRAVKRIHLVKPDGSPRPIGIPTIVDRILQNMVKNALEPEWEAVFVGYTYGFRPARSINDAVGRIRSILIPKKRVWVLEVDTAKCFDSISHDHMLQKLEHFPAKDLIAKWLNAGILLEEVWLETPTGTPQGGVISPLLCNIAMHGLGEELGVIQEKDGRIRSSSPYSIVIFADDMVIFADSKEKCEEAKVKLECCLSTRGLKLNEAKTSITLAYDGFDFLGFNFVIQSRFGRSNTPNYFVDNNNTVVITGRESWLVPIAQPSQKSIKNVKLKLKQVFALHKATKTDILIKKLNSIIRGWANSKRRWYYWKVCKHLDFYLWGLIRRYMHRRHPNKSESWKANKYFSLGKKPELGFRDKWTFRDPDTNRPLLRFYWFYEPMSKKKDWIQIASLRCPDDPSPVAKEYFKVRQSQLVERRLIDFTSKKDQYLAKKQGFICPICADSLFNDEPLHRHHIVELSRGGLDTLSNLRLVHLPCHYRIHYGSQRELMDNRLKNAILGPVKPLTGDEPINPILELVSKEDPNILDQIALEMDSIDVRPSTNDS